MAKMPADSDAHSIINDVSDETYQPGTVVAQKYNLKCLRIRQKYLDIYTATGPNHGEFEVHVYSLSCPTGKLLESRKRRVRRIFNSPNFRDSEEKPGKKIIVMELTRTEGEWQNLATRSNGKETLWL
ncbi:hypothetical protein F5X99DRAFT_381347 [Biscogniauxia marginata]|nr:hypothetical protein F5X99DRAFT_381347 [Biscogniauxia marginata]